MISAGSGKYRVWLKEIKQGEDVVLLLGGGERTHIGSVILCEPGKETRTITRENHFDWIVGKPIAEKLARKRKKPVVCIAGIHVDNASREEIELLKNNCREIEGKL